MDRLLVAFRTRQAHLVLQAGGFLPEQHIANVNPAGAIEYLGIDDPTHGLWIWEGEASDGPGDSNKDGDVFSHCDYIHGTWRQPTPEEWTKIQAGEQLWPSEINPDWPTLQAEAAAIR